MPSSGKAARVGKTFLYDEKMGVPEHLSGAFHATHAPRPDQEAKQKLEEANLSAKLEIALLWGFPRTRALLG